MNAKVLIYLSLINANALPVSLIIVLNENINEISC